jgi:hypothetical protein
MNNSLGFTTSLVTAKRIIGAFVLVLLLLGAGMARADSKDDLANRKRDWDSMKGRVDDVSSRTDVFLEDSRKLREMDATDLKELITEMCKLDIGGDDDRAEELAQKIRDDMMKKVGQEYDKTYAEGSDVTDKVKRVLDDMASLRDKTKDLTSSDDVKDEASRLASEIQDRIERLRDRVLAKLDADYRSLTNVKEGTMNGSNNPKIRAAMEYGKEKHKYNQQMCEVKEVKLDSGHPDCVSFQKDACAVWEFKPDSTFSDSSAADWAKKYVADVQKMFKDDQRAIENCKKDSDGLPIFEAKGAVYPACRP